MKKILKFLWDEFIYGGHLVAIGPVVIVLVFSRLLELKISLLFLSIIYFITYIVHSFDRYWDIDEDSSTQRLQHFKIYKKILPFIILLLVAIITLTSFAQSLDVLIISLVLIGAGIVYSLLLKKLTRFIVGFKSFYVATVFASVVVFTAFYNQIDLVSPAVLIMFFFFALRWFANTTFCDLKDRKQDKIAGLKTFAVTLSSKHFYVLLIIINLLSIIPLIIGVYLKVIPPYSLLLAGTIFYYYYYLYLEKFCKQNIQTLSNVWADGESVVWLILGYLGGLLWG